MIAAACWEVCSVSDIAIAFDCVWLSGTRRDDDLAYWPTDQQTCCVCRCKQDPRRDLARWLIEIQPSVQPHYLVLYSVSWGTDRGSLEELNCYIQSKEKCRYQGWVCLYRELSELALVLTRPFTEKQSLAIRYAAFSWTETCLDL